MTATVVSTFTDLTTPRGWSLIIGLLAAAAWSLGGGIGNFEHSWMPWRAWARSASQAAVAGIGVGVAAYIGWNDYPAVPGNATVVAIGLGWSAVGSAVGAALWPIAGGGVPKIGAFVERLFQVDNRLHGVIKDKLAARPLDELTAKAELANEIANTDSDSLAANKRRLKAAADRGEADLVIALRKLIVAKRITRGALSAKDGFFTKWPP